MVLTWLISQRQRTAWAPEVSRANITSCHLAFCDCKTTVSPSWETLVASFRANWFPLTPWCTSSLQEQKINWENDPLLDIAVSLWCFLGVAMLVRSVSELLFMIPISLSLLVEECALHMRYDFDFCRFSRISTRKTNRYETIIWKNLPCSNELSAVPPPLKSFSAKAPKRDRSPSPSQSGSCMHNDTIGRPGPN